MTIREYRLDLGFWLMLREVSHSFRTRLFNICLSRRLRPKSRTDIHFSAYLRGLSNITIGEGFYAGRGLWLEARSSYRGETFQPRIVIGDHVFVQEHVHIGATTSVSIGNHVLIASRVYISDHHHGSYNSEHQSDPDMPPAERTLTTGAPVVIEDNVWIGDLVSILPGVTIGRGSVIGCNSVVSRSIPADSIAVGSPARVIKRFDRSLRKWIPV